MPWSTPTLADLRKLNRDNVSAGLGTGALIPNSVLRVLADGNAGLAYLTLQYIDWLSRQFLPDTAEGEWLRDRHAKIWLGGWKQATFAQGSISASGVQGTVIPLGTRLTASTPDTVLEFETTQTRALGATATSIPIIALAAGSASNLETGTRLGWAAALPGVNAAANVETLAGGADEESDDELRVRVLDRIRKPPMGGDADDFVAWALEVPGVTRAWCSPLEMGVGTVTVRFLMDDLRADAGGMPNADDIAAVQAHLDAKRPVAVKDFFVVAPIFEPINFTISNLTSDDAGTRANIEAAVDAMLRDQAAPARAINGVSVEAQTIYEAWVSAAILSAVGVDHFDLTFSDHAMPSPGHMAVLGTISYDG